MELGRGATRQKGDGRVFDGVQFRVAPDVGLTRRNRAAVRGVGGNSAGKKKKETKDIEDASKEDGSKGRPIRTGNFRLQAGRPC